MIKIWIKCVEYIFRENNVHWPTTPKRRFTHPQNVDEIFESMVIVNVRQYFLESC
jgi:hypothetical protein